MTKQKLACITGCSRGLGRAMVAEFAKAGWIVAGCARSAESVTALKKAFPAPHGFFTCDVASEKDVAGFCAAILKQFGPPDLVLNNAAIINRNAPIWEVPAEEFSAVIDVNIKGVAAMMRHLLPAMMERGSGVIVNFSSGWGRSTSAEVAPYCATKFAIEGLSQAVAQETGGKVAVAAMNPGIINTEMLQSTFGSDAGHYPSPEEWAQTAAPYLMGLGPRHNGRALTAP